MNTPAHVVINLLVLSRNPNHRKSLAIVAGALIPDMVIIVFYGWHKLIGTAERQIWSIEYYQPFWQGWIDSFNSIPLILLAMLLCWKMRPTIARAYTPYVSVSAKNLTPLSRLLWRQSP
ncbi:MAG: hypothetical protein ACI9LO_002853 [Planctomycetota bacterium]|jgi:hypothetical protein